MQLELFRKPADMPTFTDTDDFESRWNACKNDILRCIYKMKDFYKADSPEDILQDVATILIEKETTTTIRNFFTYGCGIARKLMAGDVRYKTRVRRAIDEMYNCTPDSETEADCSCSTDSVIKRALLNAIRDKLYKTFNEKERVAYDCFFRRTLSHEYAARKMNVKTTTLFASYAWDILPRTISEVFGVSRETVKRIIVKQRTSSAEVRELSEHGEITIRDADGNVIRIIKIGEASPALPRSPKNADHGTSLGLFPMAA